MVFSQPVDHAAEIYRVEFTGIIFAKGGHVADAGDQGQNPFARDRIRGRSIPAVNVAGDVIAEEVAAPQRGDRRAPVHVTAGDGLGAERAGSRQFDHRRFDAGTGTGSHLRVMIALAIAPAKVQSNVIDPGAIDFLPGALAHVADPQVEGRLPIERKTPRIAKS